MEDKNLLGIPLEENEECGPETVTELTDGKGEEA